MSICSKVAKPSKWRHRSFLQEDLVDELFIGIGPVLLGDGIPGFPAKFPQRDFKLTKCKSCSNGSVGLRY
jgi:dihydrofolate reductase